MTRRASRNSRGTVPALRGGASSRGAAPALRGGASVDFDALRAAAEAVLSYAHAPYSRLQVAAALVDASGRVFTGVNVENASYGLTVCAERNALAAAVGAGARAFGGLVVVSSAPHAITPCGACRQVLFELAPELALRCYGRDGSERATTTRELLPHAFAAADVPQRAARKPRPAPAAQRSAGATRRR